MPKRFSPWLGLLFLGSLIGCSRTPAEDDRFGPVEDFSLTERSGRTIGRADLNGKVWVAACVFTRCTGACPLINGIMARLHQELAAEKDVILVSISVDPEHDTPEVLQTFAAKWGADPERWLFLTGPKDRVYHLIKNGFRLNVRETQGSERTPGNEVDHSPRLVVVDRHGEKRALIDARDGDAVERVRKKITALLQEK